MATEQMVFRITWRESIQARLVYLIDNGVIVLDLDSPSDDRLGQGQIVHPYSVPASPIHRIQWLLWFPGQTLTELLAEASRGPGSSFQPLDQASGLQQRWADTGAL